MTPTRTARLEEKHQLQELNKRLEMYILKQRERDASLGGAQRDIDVVKDTCIREVKTISENFETQLRSARQTRDEHSASIAKLSEDNSR
jgi:hypothetical protein